MLARGVETGLREIDPEHRGTASGERLAQQAAAAADVEHARARKRGALGDVIRAQAVDLVQRLERPVRIPPPAGLRRELRELCRIDVAHL